MNASTPAGAPAPALNAATLVRATRAYSLPAAVIPVLLGTALAARGYAFPGHAAFHGLSFALTLVGALLAQSGANVLNDYFDFVKGVDTRPEHGSGVVTGGLMTPRQTLIYGCLLMAGAAVCGLALTAGHAAVVVPLALIGLGCAVLYPTFLKQYALGDLLIILAFGVGLTVGAYGVQVGSLSRPQWLLVSLYALPVSLLVDGILHANNLRDAPDDRAAHVRTLATLLPPRGARSLLWFLLFGPVLFVALGVASGLLPLWSLATLLAVPLLIRAYKTGDVPGTAQTHLVFGILYAASLLFKPVFV